MRPIKLIRTASRLILFAAAVDFFAGSLTAAEQPRLVREEIEWCRMWVPGVGRQDKAHVLLIGDSITEAYSTVVEKQLGDLAYVAKLTTSKSLGDPAYLQEVALVLQNESFDVIHFNNGMHGSGYSETEYRRDFPKLLELLQESSQGAKLICATTTPKRVAHQLDRLDPFTQRIKARNRIAEDFSKTKHIPVDDLFTLVENRPDFYSDDGTHFKSDGVQAEGEQVAERIKALLPAKSGVR